MQLVKGWFNESLSGFPKPDSGRLRFYPCRLRSLSVNADDLRTHGRPHSTWDGTGLRQVFNYPRWRQGEYLAFQELLQAEALPLNISAMFSMMNKSQFESPESPPVPSESLPRLGILIAQHPAINHAVILREIRELRKYFDVWTVSIRSPDRPVEKLTAEESDESGRTCKTPTG